MDDEKDIITLIDDETGKEISLEHVDAFEYKGNVYDVLLTITENEDDTELVFMKEVLDENGELYLESLDDEEDDEVYDAYIDIVEETLEEDDECEDSESEE